MTLSKYLRLKKLSDSDFAVLVRRDRTTVLRWRNGTTRPDWVGLSAILEITNGKVTPNDFLVSADDA